MTGRDIALGAAILALGIPGLAAAQGLGETADRERERREKESQEKGKESAPVFTNHDLDAIRPPEAKSDSDSEDDSGDDAASSSASPRREERRRPSGRVRGRDDAGRARRDEVSRAQAEVDGIEARIRELNGKLNPMSRDYVYGEARNVDAANEELRIREELNELENDLRQARRDLSEVSSGGRGNYEPRDEIVE